MTTPLPDLDTTFLLDFLTGLLNTPSPTGYTESAIHYVEKALKKFPALELRRTRKGALVATWRGQKNDAPRALSVHVDTLGAMVKEIKSNGRLKLSKVGSYALNTVEGEGCTVFASGGKAIRGAFLLNDSSAHVHGKQVNDAVRAEENMEIRLDERTVNAEETRGLGIEVGDFVAFDPRVEVVKEFVRSRHLDDKACVACAVAAFKALADAGLQPLQDTILFVSNFEEVGHGAAVGIPREVAELLVVDMAAIGEGQTSDEFYASICVKDSGGPYSHALNQRLRKLAKQYAIDYKVDIYPYYGSDGGAYWHAGGDVQVALIGPGVDASHNYERTHLRGLIATTQWILAYLLN
jgi:putative aminopeptidase FrvX